MIRNIQALRALAAFLVVFAHLHQILSPFGVGDWLLRLGGTGVDLFFVISGFVMVYTQSRHPLSAQGFFVNRVIRVVPMYWLITIILAIVGFVLPSAFDNLRISGVDVLRSLLFIPYISIGPVPFPILNAGWTLNYEMFFYAIFSIAILAAGRRLLAINALVIATLVAVVAAGLVFPVASVPYRFFTNSIILEFAFGMVLAALFLRELSMPRLVGALLLILGATLIAIGSTSFYDLLPRVIFVGVPAAAVVTAALVLERHGIVLRSPAIQLMGAASYALYLVHVPAVAVVRKAAAFLGSSPALSILSAVTALIVATLSAVVVHWFIERPLTNGLRRAVGHGRMDTTRAEPSLWALLSGRAPASKG